MEKVTFVESIIKILNLIASVPFFIEILILSFVLLIAIAFFYFRKSKKGKITSLIIYIVTLFLLPISHFSFFADTLDKIVENYIEILYFPSCYVYMFLLIMTDISVLKNIIKNVKSEERKWYGLFDLVYFFIFQFLFFMIIRTVISENINIFDRAQLYSNTSLISLLQISSYLFWIRIGIKLVVLIVNRLSKDGPNIRKTYDNREILSEKKTSKTMSVAENIDNKIEDNIDLVNSTVPKNVNTEKTASIFNNDVNKSIDGSLKKNASSLQDFPINRNYEQNTINQTNNVGINSLNSTKFITDIDTTKNKTVKLLGDDFLKPNLDNSMQNIKTFKPEVEIENAVGLKNVEISLDLNEDEEKFFDDFYE